MAMTLPELFEIVRTAPQDAEEANSEPRRGM
jgi:hypothetical protein